MSYGELKVAKCFLSLQLKTFRKANEERYTHRYQTPFYDRTSLRPTVVTSKSAEAAYLSQRQCYASRSDHGGPLQMTVSRESSNSSAEFLK